MKCEVEDSALAPFSTAKYFFQYIHLQNSIFNLVGESMHNLCSGSIFNCKVCMFNIFTCKIQFSAFLVNVYNKCTLGTPG